MLVWLAIERKTLDLGPQSVAFDHPRNCQELYRSEHINARAYRSNAIGIANQTDGTPNGSIFQKGLSRLELLIFNLSLCYPAHQQMPR